MRFSSMAYANARSSGLLKNPVSEAGGMEVQVAWASAMVCRDNPPWLSCPPWLSFIRTGTEACPYGEQFDDRNSLPS